MSNGSNPDQDRQYVGLDLGPNCSQMLSADDKSPTNNERVKCKSQIIQTGKVCADKIVLDQISIPAHRGAV